MEATLNDRLFKQQANIKEISQIRLPKQSHLAVLRLFTFLLRIHIRMNLWQLRFYFDRHVGKAVDSVTPEEAAELAKTISNLLRNLREMQKLAQKNMPDVLTAIEKSITKLEEYHATFEVLSSLEEREILGLED